MDFDRYRCVLNRIFPFSKLPEYRHRFHFQKYRIAFVSDKKCENKNSGVFRRLFTTVFLGSSPTQTIPSTGLDSVSASAAAPSAAKPAPNHRTVRGRMIASQTSVCADPDPKPAAAAKPTTPAKPQARMGRTSQDSPPAPIC